MCGRITQRLSAAELADYFEAEPLEMLPPPRFNLAPSQQAIVVIVEGGRRLLATYDWGLDGSWAEAAPINARAETVATSPLFREPFRRFRCVVPVDGFYEWQHSASSRQPFLVRRRDGDPMSLAGLWLPARSADGDRRPTFTIVTTRANEVVARLHDRMPVVLSTRAWQRWLDPATPTDQLVRLLMPAPAAELEAYPVSRRVNDVRNDDARLIEPLAIPVAVEQPGFFDAELG